VDDDPSVCEALQFGLRGLYVVHAVATGQEACDLLRVHPIAAIILDAILGEEHGLDLVEQFRARSPAPILMLTGYSTEALAIRAVWAGVRGYLKKPPDLEALRAALGRLVTPSTGSADPLEQVRVRLGQDLHLPVSIQELAELAGLHPDYLRQAFTGRFGLSPRAYREACRMRRAASLLRGSDLPIKVIGPEVGFADPNSFSVIFKRCHGVSPERFRLGSRDDPGESGSRMSSGIQS
jgi:AraC-like DNA-binding protein